MIRLERGQLMGGLGREVPGAEGGDSRKRQIRCRSGANCEFTRNQPGNAGFPPVVMPADSRAVTTFGRLTNLGQGAGTPPKPGDRRAVSWVLAIRELWLQSRTPNRPPPCSAPRWDGSKPRSLPHRPGFSPKCPVPSRSAPSNRGTRRSIPFRLGYAISCPLPRLPDDKIMTCRSNYPKSVPLDCSGLRAIGRLNSILFRIGTARPSPVSAGMRPRPSGRWRC